jgi:hypothetical protein
MQSPDDGEEACEAVKEIPRAINKATVVHD